MLFAARWRRGILTDGPLPANRLLKACPLKSRPIIFRLTAVLLGLSVFPAFEGVCRVAGWGTETVKVDAWQQFAGTRPLFERTPDGTSYRIAANRREFFADDYFPASKGTNTRRIFVFGGSTVQGRPFSIQTSFTTFLKFGLSHAVPDTRWEVVNCGGISYASYRLLPIMQECLAYEPDLFIVCTGHNEFLECVTYSKVINTQPMVNHGRRWLDRLQSFRVIRKFVSDNIEPATSESNNDRTQFPEEVDALLDHQGGLERFTRTALHRSEIAQQFAENLQHMVELTSAADVPLIMMSPPVNLRDCPPFKSEFSADTSAADRDQVASELKTAGDKLAHDVAESITLLKHATQLDPAFAFSWYQLGRACLQAKQIDLAKEALQRAVDEDVCPLRMTSDLQRAMRRVVERNGIAFLDVQPMMEAGSRLGIVGDFVLADHIHPAFGSHQQIGLELVVQVAAKLNRSTTPDWKPLAQKTFDNHMQSLDDLYFLRGRRTLANLRAWTQGRADGPPLSQDPSAP
ncbi:MAG: tetratricopeptide repeat protein [Planctomycetaceae bacterium]